MRRQARWTAAKQYRIVVRGEFGELLTSAFADLSVQAEGGETILVTPAIDGSQLHGVLDRLLGFAVEIVSMNELARPNTGGGEARV